MDVHEMQPEPLARSIYSVSDRDTSTSERLAAQTPDACEWFHATLDRASAERLLLPQGEDGLFLVRPSGSSPGDFALSVAEGGQVLHLQVHRHREDAFFSVNGGPVVHGLEELVHQGSQEGGAPWGQPLGRPCPGGGPPPPDTRRHGRTNLLHRATRQGDLVVVNELLRVGYATEAKDEQGRTAVHLACLAGHTELLAALLAAGAAPSGPDICGRHPLHYACEWPDAEMVKELLSAGASAQARDADNGWVPLHVAAARGHACVVRALLDHGAPARPRTLRHELPADLAAQGRHSDCVHVLEVYERPTSTYGKGSWLHPPHVDRECAARLLSTTEEGTFLLRRGRRSSYVLSLAGPTSIYHFEIHSQGPYVHIDDGPLLSSLEHLVAHYSNFEDGLPVRLAQPLAPDEPPPVGPRSLTSQRQTPTMTAVISRDSLRLGQTLGEGEYGSVLQGLWLTSEGTEVSVAVKKLREVSASEGFAREAELMVDLRHPCIVRLLAICLGPPLMMVQELLPLGSLLGYLQERCGAVSMEEDVPRWAHQVACGMAYLQARRFVHRDLAARNLLLASRMQVKISDFGLSRALAMGSDYYRATTGGRWPLKWYAPESVNFGTFSHASDAWSFGITLWEMYTLGELPYGSLTGVQVLALVERGERLAQPEGCPDWAYAAMQHCWRLSPDERPPFSNLAALFAAHSSRHLCAGCDDTAH
ncbi:SH2 ankyrin repeat kinase isoform X2 [Dermacentor variabilis]|uniref:SH2 ankyrin repeat kinase isoform X2 n=1 Tax=Dermacentor variabilis TaxID=34621 RepID=UPI003F5BF6A5